MTKDVLSWTVALLIASHNMKYLRTYKNNRLGVRGIRKLASGNYWVRTSIGGGKQKTVGTFRTLKEAKEALNG